MINFQYPRLTIGIAPTRRDFWNNDATNRNLAAIESKIKQLADKFDFIPVDLSQLDFGEKVSTIGSRKIVNHSKGMMTDYKDALLAAEYFKEKKIDALFIPHCNFGQEEAVAKLASELKVPVLLWGPQDAPPDDLGARPTDTQCGLFAASKVLSRYKVTFTYIENSPVDSELFENGFRDFLAVANTVKAFRNLRIAQISVRPQQFLSVMVNEAELLEKFNIEIVPISGAALTNRINQTLETKKTEIDELLEDIERTINLDQLGDKKQVMAAIELTMMELAREYQCNAIASDCWHTIRNNFGLAPCFIFGDLNDRGLPCACELDIHGAITSVLAIAAARYKAPSFVADLTLKHPENPNAELFWHCGPFAKSLKREDAQGYVVKGGQGFYPLKHGEVTVLRFDGINGTYNCFSGLAKTVDGPVTNGNYLWLEAENWSRWEKKLIYGPYIHHVIGIYGDYRDIIEEACRYLNIYYDAAD